MTEFQDFLQKQIEKKMDSENEASEEGENSLKGILSRPLSWILKESCERKNYVFFSTYEIGEEGESALYLGLFDRFVRLRKSDNLNVDLNI